MKSITIKGSERESVGKVATKALRNAGLVPCIIRRKSGSSFQQKLKLSKTWFTLKLTQLRSILKRKII
jgi:ribosomal protein L25 (general stress protein Ctc)